MFKLNSNDYVRDLKSSNSAKIQASLVIGKSSDRQVPTSLYFNKMERGRPPKENKITNAKRCKPIGTGKKKLIRPRTPFENELFERI